MAALDWGKARAVGLGLALGAALDWEEVGLDWALRCFRHFLDYLEWSLLLPEEQLPLMQGFLWKGYSIL